MKINTSKGLKSITMSKKNKQTKKQQSVHTGFNWFGAGKFLSHTGHHKRLQMIKTGLAICTFVSFLISFHPSANSSYTELTTGTSARINKVQMQRKRPSLCINAFKKMSLTMFGIILVKDEKECTTWGRPGSRARGGGNNLSCMFKRQHALRSDSWCQIHLPNSYSRNVALMLTT